MIFPTLDFLLFFLVVWPLAWALAKAPTAWAAAALVGAFTAGLLAMTGRPVPMLAILLAGTAATGWAFLRGQRHLAHKLAIIAASYCFYAFWNWRLAGLLLTSVVLNWLTGRLIDGARGTVWAARWCALGVVINLSVLGFFKYYDFFLQSLAAALTTIGIERDMPWLEIVLPIGISFFTFQGISYVVDLKRGDLDRSRPLVDVMFFISFFPHLVAGPIVRAARFLPQLETPPDPRRTFIGLGLLLILWGVVKKAIIANVLATRLVDKVFFDPTVLGTIDVLAGVYGYAVQIYCDFSAYSDIAIGIAALLGYRFQRNFDQPYRATSLRDFWHRWHMSLSQWLRDYLYRPLGGNRGGRWQTYRNLLLTMILGGLWHGAAWRFLLWGALHGIGLAIERLWHDWRSAQGKAPAASTLPLRIVTTIVTFHVVCLGWILFRSESVTRAGEVIEALGRWQQVELLNAGLALLIVIGMAINFTPPDLLQRLHRLYVRWPVWASGVAAASVLLVVEALAGDGTAPFIYFQF